MSVRLNDAQAAAVEHAEGPMLVLAGAGSGKTRVITHRALRLVERGVEPAAILCVTFTNKAAREMKERLSDMGGVRLAAVPVMTFHAFCLRLLKMEGRKLGRLGSFALCDVSDQEQCLIEVCRDLSMDPAKVPLRDIQFRIGLARNRLQEASALAASPDPLDRMAAIFMPRYRETLQRMNLLDFDDLLVVAVRLLESDEKLRQRLAKRFRYLMVDEYQDTCRAQVRLVELLGAHGNVMVVGDDDQSIYAWRGADAHNILAFPEVFPGAVSVKLEENYRSTATILAAANAVIAVNEARSQKTLRPTGGRGERIRVIAAEDPWAEAEAVVDDIEADRLSNLGMWRDYAILYRTNTQAKPFEDVLRRRGIPCLTSSRTDFYDRKEVKDAIAYLKVLAHPEDDLSFLRIHNWPKRGVGAAALAKLKAKSAEETIPLTQAAERLLEDKAVDGAASTGLSAFLGLLESHAAAFAQAEGDFGDKISDYFADLGLAAEIARESADEAMREKRLASLKSLVEQIRAYAKKARRPSLQDWLLKLALFFSQESQEAEEAFREDAVLLITVHASKGLEFDRVVIGGFEEGMMPFMRDGLPLDEAALAEERRLAYVAITRARKSLVLTRSLKRKRREGEVMPEPSRFLADIPPDLLERYDIGESPTLSPGAAVREKRRENAFEKLRLAGEQRLAARGLPPTV